jgi:hypothetical protein
MPLTTVFDDLPHPRRDTENKLHRLTDILTIATCAVIGRAEIPTGRSCSKISFPILGCHFLCGRTM